MKYNPRDPKRMERIREISEMMPQYDHTKAYFKKFSLLRYVHIRESNRTTPLLNRETPEEQRFYRNDGRMTI